MASNTLWSQENFSCPICLDVYNSPVTTPCGHNFCRTCLTTCWDGHALFKCPLCKEIFFTRPDVRVNTLLSDMVDQFQMSIQVKVQPCVRPGEVPFCDVCTRNQQKAVKSCLVCLISYCQTHLEPHERVAGLKRHQLVEPIDRLEDRICKKHNRLLELFCQTEQMCVCQFCKEAVHMSHTVVPLNEEYEVKRAQLGKNDLEVQQMIQERQKKIQEIKDVADRSKAAADREFADGVSVLTALMRHMEKWRDDLNETVKDKLKSIERQAEGHTKQVEREIEVLIKRSSEVKQLLHTEDPLHFLQTFRPLKNPLPTWDWTTLECLPSSYFVTLRRSLDQLMVTLNKEVKILPVRKSTLKKYACELTLDQNTTHRRISLSEDNREMTLVAEQQSYPDHPGRYDSCPQVLFREALPDRCYWEVERKKRVEIAVTYGGTTRQGRAGDCRFGRNGKSWSLYCHNLGYAAWHADIRTAQCHTALSNRVGVYLDKPAGTLSFYNITQDVEGSSDPLTHLHTFYSTFTQEDLHLGIGLWRNGASVSLCPL